MNQFLNSAHNFLSKSRKLILKQEFSNVAWKTFISKSSVLNFEPESGELDYARKYSLRSRVSGLWSLISAKLFNTYEPFCIVLGFVSKVSFVFSWFL